MVLALIAIARPLRTSARRKAMFAAGALAGLASAFSAHADEASCKALAGKTYPASVMSMPSTGAKVGKADWITERPNFQAYCKLTGEIAPVDPKATSTLFAINLPASWNKKVVQEGGGGLNGTLVQANNLLRDAPPGSAPLAKGYVTLGTDSGHPNAKPEIGVFLLNKEELVNNAYGSNRNAHDLSLAVIGDYYGGKPARYYFFGGSEGGRQAMSMVQLFPKDYDGVVAVVPALNSVSNFIAKYHAWRATFDGGWYDRAKIKLLQDESARQCDQLDGIKDGVISKYRACLAVFKFDPIRCAGGKDTGDTCLSDKQIAAAKVWRSPYSWGFPLKNGITTLAGWSVGGENAPGSLNPWIMLDQPPEAELSGTDINASQYIRYGVMADKDFRGDLDLKDPKVRTRIQALSNLTDQNNPDLTPFFKRGGKLIMKENTGDYAISPESNFAFYNQIVAKMGKPTVAKFLRFYVNPGVNHGGSGTRADGTPIPDKVDLLAELDKWVETGAAPGPLTVAAYKDGKATAAKPLCELPLYPRYKGAGDPDAAASYACVPH